MPHTWHAVDVRTGLRGPQLRVQQRGTVSRIIGEVTDTQVSVLCWDQEAGAPVPEWRDWTQPGRMMLVLVDDDDRPIWGGIVVRRVPDQGIWVPLTLASTEHYFSRRYTGQQIWFGADQSMLVAGIVQNITFFLQGIPFVYSVQTSGIDRDRSYLDSDDKTVLSALQELMNVQNGPEFTVDLEWSDPTNTVLNRILRAAPRIGTAILDPVRFEHPGPVRTFSAPEDYTADNGANDVMAYSSGEGEFRPQSDHFVDTAALASSWVRYEKRSSPSTSITSKDVLDAHAEADFVRVRNGLLELELVADLDTAPRVNRDWWLGDDIIAAITAPAFPEIRDPDGSLRPGYEKRVRVVGWSMDLDARTLTPMLREA